MDETGAGFTILQDEAVKRLLGSWRDRRVGGPKPVEGLIFFPELGTPLLGSGLRPESECSRQDEEIGGKNGLHYDGPQLLEGSMYCERDRKPWNFFI
mgnify:CR=1 FL=1